MRHRQGRCSGEETGKREGQRQTGGAESMCMGGDGSELGQSEKSRKNTGQRPDNACQTGHQTIWRTQIEASREHTRESREQREKCRKQRLGYREDCADFKVYGTQIGSNQQAHVDSVLCVLLSSSEYTAASACWIGWNDCQDQLKGDQHVACILASAPPK
jgi:hypothetical protein